MIPRKPSLSATYSSGQRVQLHPGTDSWMRGDRYGDVVKVTRKLVHVRLDKSGRTAKLHPSHILAVL